MKKLRLSLYVLGILIIGMKSFAMDVSTSQVDPSKSKMSTNLAGDNEYKLAYDKEIKQGRSTLYAKYYIELVKVRKIKTVEARVRSTVFELEVLQGRDRDYADYYAKLATCAETNKSLIRIQADLFSRARLKGHSYVYSDYYARHMVSSTLGKRATKFQSEIFEREVLAGNTDEYADYYAQLIAQDIPERIAREKLKSLQIRQDFEEIGLSSADELEKERPVKKKKLYGEEENGYGIK